MMLAAMASGAALSSTRHFRPNEGVEWAVRSATAIAAYNVEKPLQASEIWSGPTER